MFRRAAGRRPQTPAFSHGTRCHCDTSVKKARSKAPAVASGRTHTEHSGQQCCGRRGCLAEDGRFAPSRQLSIRRSAKQLHRGSVLRRRYTITSSAVIGAVGTIHRCSLSAIVAFANGSCRSIDRRTYDRHAARPRNGCPSSTPATLTVR